MARLKKVKITNGALLSIIRFIDGEDSIKENTHAAFALPEKDNVICLYLFNPEFEENNESIIDIVNNSGANVEQIKIIVNEKFFQMVIEEAKKIKKFLEAEEYRKSIKYN